MARIYDHAYLGDRIVPIGEATLSIASSAVLYGLSVYTVFPVVRTASGLAAFRLPDHYRRLIDSARIIGIDTFAPSWDYARFESAVRELIAANAPAEDVFVRSTVHVDELVAGTRSRGLHSSLSIFVYEAAPILPRDGARLKTSHWRRVSDDAVPARAKVNGAYVNSVLAKQDALDAGYDDCVLLDAHGRVAELSAANIFLVRGGALVTPDSSSDLLEGINRRTVIEVARSLGIPVVERSVALTELYVSDEIFACGTSAMIASVYEVDGRVIGSAPGPVTTAIRDAYARVMRGEDPARAAYLTAL